MHQRSSWRRGQADITDRRLTWLRPSAGVNDADFGSLVVMLGDGSDRFGVGDVGVGFANWGRRVEQLVA